MFLLEVSEFGIAALFTAAVPSGAIECINTRGR
jgi:hypothetical protein